jgi:hypothetical protein
MAPDWAYVAGRDWLGFPSHSMGATFVWALPVAFAVSWGVRNRAAAVAAHLPNAGPLRLRSLGVLGERRPPWWLTALCAWIGAVCHVGIDSFTHIYRRGSNLLGLNDVAFHIGDRRILEAEVLQYLGHTAGSLVAVVMLWWIAQRGLLEQWYGDEAVERAQRAPTSVTARVTMAVGGIAGLFFASAWCAASGASLLFAGPVGVGLGVAGSTLLLARRAEPPEVVEVLIHHAAEHVSHTDAATTSAGMAR